jgi:hypothetical protein
MPSRFIPEIEIEAEAEAEPPVGDDLLLEELFNVHHNWPGTHDYTPALNLPPERYLESPRNRREMFGKQQKR